MMKEVRTKCWHALTLLNAEQEGDQDGQQLRVSLWSHVVQVRTERRRPGTTQGCRFRGSRYESTGLGDVRERSLSPEGVGKTGATFFPRDPSDLAHAESQVRPHSVIANHSPFCASARRCFLSVKAARVAVFILPPPHVVRRIFVSRASRRRSGAKTSFSAC